MGRGAAAHHITWPCVCSSHVWAAGWCLPVCVHSASSCTVLKVTQLTSLLFSGTVEPRFTDTRLIRTPRYYGQFRWSRRRPHTFSLKLTRLIRTPVNTDNGHFSVSRVTNPYTLSTPLYGHCLSVHCQFSLSRLFANLKTLDPGQIMTEFDELKRFYYKE